MDRNDFFEFQEIEAKAQWWEERQERERRFLPVGWMEEDAAMTTKVNHTPGPWAVEKNAPCYVSCEHETQGQYQEICMQVWGRTWQEAYKNAQLIAAAPEMLATLKTVLDHLDGSTNSYNQDEHNAAVAKVREQVEDAIQKAEEI